MKELVSDGTRLKIALIGPGIMEIPPQKWGAVEMVIWDYTQIIKALGHRVEIINTPDKDLIKFEVEHGRYDIVHLHYDVLYDITEGDEYEGLSGTSAIVYVKVLVVPTDTLYSPL